MRRIVPLLALLAFACGAGAQTSPWYIGGAQTVTHESNLYRLAHGADESVISSKADLISSTALLAGLDQPVGRQRLYGTLTLRANRFQDNDTLDNDAYSLRAGVDWETVNRLSGNVDLSTNRNLARFDTSTTTGVQTERNVETSRRMAATVRVGVVTQYTAEASLEHQDVDFSADAYAPRENKQTTATAGVRWRPGGSTVFGAGLRHTRGEYPRALRLPDDSFQADRYTRTGLDLIANVEVGGASRIDSRLTLGRTTYDEATQRDTSGVTGFVAWIWQPGAKLRLDTRLARDTGQSSYFSGNPGIDGAVDDSRTTTSLRLRADYLATAKIRLNAGVTYARRDLVRTGPPTAQVPLGASGSDDTTEFTLGATWEPTRSLVFGCDLGHEKRSASGVLSLPYSASRMSCYGQIFLR